MARHIIIPARLKSTRLPNKPLLDIAGKPMIMHVYQRALQCGFDSVTVATDSKEIADVISSINAKVCMTDVNHATGTDRLAETVDKLKLKEDDIIVNIQGDEPLIPLENVKEVADLLADKPEASVATLCELIEDEEEIFNSNVVKVVMDKDGFALYFSRAPIPWQRGYFEQKQALTGQTYRHIGLYAYRVGFLRRFAEMEPSRLESLESLEQLRVLWQGEKIAVATAKTKTPPGVDTIEDLEKIRGLMS
ncbi:MAG: 3-deoxy-manno-octulosonate cytidylyltransferase [Francisellaceae bacterium]